jgi:uncharacterized protein GlcG (DUF336 family)
MSPFRVSWRSVRFGILALLIALIMPAPVAFAQTTVLPQLNSLPLDLALQGANAALAQCRSDGFQVSVAVIDLTGLPKVHLRDDNAGLHTLFSSLRKAYTATSFGRTTLALEGLLREGPSSEASPDEDPQLLFLGGGVPIILNESVIGGIGVTGAGDGALNEACAQAGVNAILAATSGLAPAEEATTTPTEEATEEPAEEPAEEATPTPEAEEEGAATTTS